MSAIQWPTIMAALFDWVQPASGLDDQHCQWAFYDAPRPSDGGAWLELMIEETRPVGHDWVTRALNVLEFADQTVTLVDVPTSTFRVPAHPFVTGDGPVLVAAGTLPTGLPADGLVWIVVVDANTVRVCDSFEHTGGNYPGNPITTLTVSDAGVGPIFIQAQPNTVRAGQEIVETASGLREILFTITCFAPPASGIAAMQITTDVMSALKFAVYPLDQAGVGVSDVGTETFPQGGVRATPGFRGEILEPRASVQVTLYVASELTHFLNFIQSLKLAVHTTTPGNVPLSEIDITVRS